MDYKTLLIFGALLTCAIAKAVPRRRNNDLYLTTKGINQFAVEFYKHTVESIKDNLISSPLSASIALSMAAYGASGATEYEMKSNLYLPLDDKVGQKGFLSLLMELHKMKKVDLKLAQGLFTDYNLEVHPEYRIMTRNFFKSPAESVDFQEPEKAAQSINRWCEKHTNNVIKDVLQPDDVKEALLVLVNAIYFKGSWKSQFKIEHTSLQPFFIDSKTSKSVPMMFQRSEFNYGLLSDGDAVYVELPYNTSDPINSLSMFVILPVEEDGLEKIEQNLSYLNFKELHYKDQVDIMELYMPKFKISSTIDLQPVLEKMGMHQMFDDRADFSKISDTPIKITKAVQKAFIEVDEEGSEAGASTGLVGGLKTGGDFSRIVVDRPFIFKIVHLQTNTIIFQGHVIDPTK